jgi:predicted nuclease of predicted toxin-antitoxin system
MNLVLDENIDRPIYDQLSRDGHIIWYIFDVFKGLSDDKVLELANSNKALLITLDKDFGDLIFQRKLISSGILLLRIAGLPNSEKAFIVSSAIKKYSEKLFHSFSVLTPKSIRIRNIYYLNK